MNRTSGPDNKNAPLPLSDAPADTSLRVVAIEGGSNFHHRLIAMGLNVGSILRVMHGANSGRGPTVIAVGDTRLAIGRGMAERIFVSKD